MIINCFDQISKILISNKINNYVHILIKFFFVQYTYMEIWPQIQHCRIWYHGQKWWCQDNHTKWRWGTVPLQWSLPFVFNRDKFWLLYIFCEEITDVENVFVPCDSTIVTRSIYICLNIFCGMGILRMEIWGFCSCMVFFHWHQSHVWMYSLMSSVIPFQ